MDHSYHTYIWNGEKMKHQKIQNTLTEAKFQWTLNGVYKRSIISKYILGSTPLQPLKYNNVLE